MTPGFALGVSLLSFAAFCVVYMLAPRIHEKRLRFVTIFSGILVLVNLVGALAQNPH